ncbi:methyl-accepting chemotaxis protein [Gellertiella hungarica]|uniref:Methyl-accepting chemotaxis protein n=1 Tax=Gellertiella hungarica TaxID=1572859 RepID=A0A7W6NJJ7_9HYPH|nr:methyl-accepting chemotaxis protein [Gellertiella hungarica]MBB4063564.1 methyl-accepting chemotaxis protein [Gellertiella hungarica]
MSVHSKKSTFSVSQRLWTLGLGAAAGVSAMIAVGVYESRVISAELAQAEAIRQEVETVVSMRHANTTMVLAAMDTLVDKAEKQVKPERQEIVASSVKTLRSGEKALFELAEALGMPDAVANFDRDLTALEKAIAVDLKALVEQGASEEAYGAIDDTIDGAGEGLGNLLSDMAARGGTAVRERLQLADEASNASLYIQLAAGVVALAGVILMQMHHGNNLRRGILAVRRSMGRILEGDIRTPVEMTDRGDEIGEMARATEQFRQAAEEKLALESQSEDARLAREQERRSSEAAQRADAEAIRFAVEALATGLGRLAAGDITATIDTPFRDDLERLRNDFNKTIVELQSVVGDIRMNSVSIQSYSQQMRSAAEDLAKRTEQQAASLEETAAALDQITTRVRNSSDKANEAGKMVDATRQTSERSGKVVSDAMAAMERIEDASREIGKIINVIDEIAFQTNLLALNAGVEAARAGEAGKGFAVVAQEVRELAGRAAGAAKDIKTLVNKSSEEVKNGVSLVTATGEVLQHIGEDVVRISDHVISIVSDTHEQNTGLSEINAAVLQMDQVTQQNAAMVEQTSAASHTLAQDADKLIQAISRFKLRERNVAYSGPQTVRETPRPQASPARALVSKVAGAFNRNAAVAQAEPVRASDNWEEF